VVGWKEVMSMGDDGRDLEEGGDVMEIGAGGEQCRAEWVDAVVMGVVVFETVVMERRPARSVRA
jgi:hypothetical protein